MMKRVALLPAILVVAGVAAALLWFRASPGPAVALPESAQAQYYDMTVTTADGREFELPDKIVTCSLEFTVSAKEGVYKCPAPHDLESLLAPPQVFAGSVGASASTLVEIDAATVAYGLPANSWQTLQIGYGATLSSPNVFLGAEFTKGESGHIENTAWPDISRGVHPSYFYYRAQTNSSGSMGTEWQARGTQ